MNLYHKKQEKMNFLSHFYFDRNSEDPHLVLGTILPDLVKNARKDWNLHPEKKIESYKSTVEHSILRGWRRHLAVDRHFHNSQFFQKHTHAIRDLIIPALKDSVVRPSFLAHISLELMLDSTLLTENHLDAEDLYVHLQQADRVLLQRFLEINNLDDTAHFFTFFEKFIQAKYLNSYRESQNLMYALNRICMRVWKDPLNETQIQILSAILGEYHESLQENYMEIYDEIAHVIDPLP
jgi:hypothetical protein